MTEGIRAFARQYKISLTDPDLKRVYDLEMSAKRDQVSAMYYARSEGRVEGRNEERRTIIVNLVKNGTPEEIIYKSVDAPQSEIDAIIAETKEK